MSLHGEPIEVLARLPDGREARVHVGVAQDPYIADKDMNTVVLELRIGHGVVATLDTILDPSQVEQARHLANRVRDGLSSGELKPTASSLGPLTDEFL